MTLVDAQASTYYGGNTLAMRQISLFKLSPIVTILDPMANANVNHNHFSKDSQGVKLSLGAGLLSFSSTIFEFLFPILDSNT